jgi:3-hydroxyacyl-CoA dehydrogenase
VRNYGPNFSVGANLSDVKEAAQTGAWDAFALFQLMTGKIKYAKKPVVVAAQGRCLGGGAEVLLHAARVCAHMELYVGLVEAGVGLVPAGGGCKELLFRATKGFAYGQMAALVSNLDKVFLGIAQAAVSMSAQHALEIGFLREGDRIIANPDDLLYQAKQEAIRLYDGGYLPPVKETVTASGEVGFYHMKNIINNMRQGNYITDHEAVIGGEIASVLSGGGALAGETIGEEQVLLLERDAFFKLSQNAKTQERINAVLTTGKPIRN